MYDTDRSSKTQLNSMIQLIEAKRHSLRQQLEDIQMVMAELEAAEQRCVNSQQLENQRRLTESGIISACWETP